MWDALALADLADAGALPVSGGTLDQTCSFVDLWTIKRSDDAYWKAMAARPEK